MQASASSEPDTGRPTGRVVGSCELRLWSLPQAERWRRSLIRAGVGSVAREDDPLSSGGRIVLVRADYVLDDGLVRALVATPGCLLAVDRPDGGRDAAAAHVPAAQAAEAVRLLGADMVPGTPLGSGVAVVGPDELGGRHNAALRKRARPFAIRLAAGTLEEAERLTFAGAYKGVTDVVTRYLWPAPARAATRWAAASGISPNMVTAASLVLVLLAMWLFAAGAFWAGLAAAWAMTFLDTVDGKLARVTLTSSRWGNVFDHGIDLIHPPFWYWAWWHGVHATGQASAEWAVSDLALWIVLGGYILGRLMEGFFIWRFGMEMHVWRRVDSLFRLVTARRNPNLLILTAATAFGRPDLGFGLVAAWTLISLAFHALRILQAAAEKARGRALSSWLSDPAPGAAST
jgi:phosphatidylglycerophosphate synthase